MLKTRVGQGEQDGKRDQHTAVRAEAVLDELALLRRAAVRPVSILDVGCGDGYDSVLFSRHGSVVAVDLAPETIADAQFRYQSSGVTFLAGDFLTMDLPGAPFDAVVTLETLSHVYDQSAFVARCARLLKPGGTLVVTTQNKTVYDYLGHAPAKGYLRNWLTARQVTALMQPHFERISIRTVAPAEPGTLRPALDGRRPPPALRLAYSHKLDRLLRAAIAPRALEHARELAGIARTIVATGSRK